MSQDPEQTHVEVDIRIPVNKEAEPKVVAMPSAKFFKIPWMSYADFKAMPEFKNNRIFNFRVNNPDGSKPDTTFIKSYLLC